MIDRIRSAEARDAAAIAAIYNHYVLNTTVSFETEAVSEDVMAGRIAEVLGIPLPWLVLERDNTLLGYAYATRWKPRQAYRFSVESSVYLRPDAIGQGSGGRLYSALIEALKPLGLHSSLGGIALPNEASIALHEKLGFRKVGQLHEIGFKQDRWIDVGYWQLILHSDANG